VHDAHATQVEPGAGDEMVEIGRAEAAQSRVDPGVAIVV
jgi:hypothetical protein